MCGPHVYKDEWTPTVGESLNCLREPLNEKDKTVAQLLAFLRIMHRHFYASSRSYIMLHGGCCCISKLGKDALRPVCEKIRNL